MIQAESDPQKRDEYLQRLMELPNQVLFCFFFLELSCSVTICILPTLFYTHASTVAYTF
jgi:hypothetical protein